MKKVLIAILIITTLCLLTWVINWHKKTKDKEEAERWHKRYENLDSIKNNNGYTIKHITKDVLFRKQIEDKEFKSLYKSSNYKECESFGFIFFDTVQHSIWIETITYLSGETDPIHSWLNVDLDGNVIHKLDSDSMYKNQIVVANGEIVGFLKNWDDKSSNFYVDYFSKEDHHLNFLSGIGSPTGNASKENWTGTAFINLKLNKGVVKFKRKATRDVDGVYSLRMDICKLPKAYTNNQERVLIYVGDELYNYEDRGLYIIKPMQH